jgi:hypothetical protein
MPHPSERLAGWLSLKWFVAGAALVADGMLLNYDLRLGVAASTLLAAVAAFWLYIALRYGSLSGSPSLRTASVERALQQENLRRMAALRTGRASGAQQGAEPAQRP